MVAVGYSFVLSYCLNCGYMRFMIASENVVRFLIGKGQLKCNCGSMLENLVGELPQRYEGALEKSSEIVRDILKGILANLFNLAEMPEAIRDVENVGIKISIILAEPIE